jgi:hypothetical protein
LLAEQPERSRVGIAVQLVAIARWDVDERANAGVAEGHAWPRFCRRRRVWLAHWTGSLLRREALVGRSGGVVTRPWRLDGCRVGPSSRGRGWRLRTRRRVGS